MRLALVVPHIFMQDKLFGKVIFSPGELAVELAEGLQKLGVKVSLFSPGSVTTKLKNITGDLSFFEQELKLRGYDYLDLLKKHPLTFISLARQVQNDLIVDVYSGANNGEFDLVHIYANEEESALAFARLCKVSVVFTHHEPFNFSTKYRSAFSKYRDLNWISISKSQRNSAPQDTNWVGNVYHGIDLDRFKANLKPQGGYLAFLGRIIEPKGVHLAIAAAKQAGMKLKIAGKHYSGHSKDDYWMTKIKPEIDGKQIEFIGHIKTDKEKQEFLGNAAALLMPSTWEEPFGMVMLEAMACGTPVIGLNNGAIPEVIGDGVSGFIVEQEVSEIETVDSLVQAIKKISTINRNDCRKYAEKNFSTPLMCRGYLDVYNKLS